MVTGFSLRLGVGWGSTCAGVRDCKNLLDPSAWAGEIPRTAAPRPRIPMHVGVILELVSLGQTGHSWSAVSLGKATHPLCLSQLLRKESDGPDHPPQLVGPRGRGRQPRKAKCPLAFRSLRPAPAPPARTCSTGSRTVSASWVMRGSGQRPWRAVHAAYEGTRHNGACAGRSAAPVPPRGLSFLLRGLGLR